jgi:integrase
MGEGIYQVTKANGIKYSVREDRRRYFMPQEWNTFIETIKNEKHYLLFLTLLHSGARIMEALHLKPSNFDFERETITFDVVKERKAKKQFYAIGKSRTFFVSKKYIKEVKSYVNRNKIAPGEYIFLDNKKLPANYSQLSNKDKKKYYQNTERAYANLLKRKLKKAGIKDYLSFSLHNLRKTYGNWMRIFDIKMEELCYRMGHDRETYQNHYGSSLIFNSQEKQEILRIMGEIK